MELHIFICYDRQQRKSSGGGDMGGWKEVGDIACQLLFSFQKNSEGPPTTPRPPVKGLFLVLNMLLTEHVNTPGEHIQML